MPGRDFYAILGVSARAAPAEIKRAYRQIAFAAHPDVGERPDSERFRRAHEAYQVLSDPARRRSYDAGLSSRRGTLAAQPLPRGAPVTIVEDFLALRPSIEEVLDHIRQNFFGYRLKSRGPRHRLGVEAVLDPDEARFGCRVPFKVPCYARCRRCGGAGEWWGPCPECYGRGMVGSARELVLEIPPASRHGQRYEVDLDNAGIDNVLLDVTIIVS